MHDAQFLGQIAVLFGTAVVVSWIFRMAKAPSIIGFLCTGMVIGPSSWKLIGQESVGQFAETGLVLLLFTIGLELSPAPLMRMGMRVVRVMVVIALGVIGVTMGTLVVAGSMSLGAALIIGIAVSLSSTAIVLKQLTDRGEVQSVMGNLITGILLLQDIFVIVVMIMMPLFLTGSDVEGGRSPLFVFSMLGALVLVALLARKMLPFFIGQLVLHGGRELITLFAVMMACGGAYLAQIAGWPPAMGACVAGLLLANADIRHQLVAEITPFRDVFNALFFIALGMTVRLDTVFDAWHWMGVAIVLTLVGKAVITIVAVKLAGWPLRIGIKVGLGLCTVSEFGYVLAREADNAGLLPETFLDTMIAYTVGTMVFGAILFPLGGKLAGRVQVILNSKDMRQLSQGEFEADETEESLNGHVVIVGFGINGQNLVQVLQSTHIPHCVIEMNHGLVHKARSMDAQVVVGDATRSIILGHAGIDRARAIVVAVNNQEDSKRIVSNARRAKPDIYIAVSTYFVTDLEPLSKLGANVVVPADFEASVKIFSHVLEEFDVPRNILAAQVAAVRAGDYGVFRGRSSSSAESMEDLLKVLQLTATQTFYLPKTSSACGKTIAEIDLRRLSGATIIAVVRDREPNTNPTPEFVLAESDVLVLVGAHEQLRQARRVLEASTHLEATSPPEAVSED